MDPTQPTPVDPAAAVGKRPLDGLRFALVGAGRVGSSIAAWLVATGAEPRWLAGRSPGISGCALARELDVPWIPLDQPSPSAPEVEIGDEAEDVDVGVDEEVASSASNSGTIQDAGTIQHPVDLLVLAVADDALSAVAQELAQRGLLATVALHCSGSQTAEVIAPLRTAGTAVGSCHPLRAFPQPLRELSTAAETWFGLDGDPPALALAERLVDAWQGHRITLDPEQRTLYHLAASLAAGGVATLLAVVEELMRAADLPPRLLDGYLALTRGALAPIEGSGTTAGAITGPAARGDQDTLDHHRRALTDKAPELLPFFDRLTAVTRRQVTREQAAHQPPTEGLLDHPEPGVDTAAGPDRQR